MVASLYSPAMGSWKCQCAPADCYRPQLERTVCITLSKTSITLTPKPLCPLQRATLLRVKWAGAAGGWGGVAGGGAHPVAQLDPGAHICPVHSSPALRSLLRLSLGQLLRWTISWLSALDRALLGIFQTSPSLEAFTVPSSGDLTTRPTPPHPKSLFCFPCRGPDELHSQAVCPGFPIHSQSVRCRFRKVSQSITYHMSMCSRDSCAGMNL